MQFNCLILHVKFSGSIFSLQLYIGFRRQIYMLAKPQKINRSFLITQSFLKLTISITRNYHYLRSIELFPFLISILQDIKIEKTAPDHISNYLEPFARTHSISVLCHVAGRASAIKLLFHQNTQTLLDAGSVCLHRTPMQNMFVCIKDRNSAILVQPALLVCRPLLECSAIVCKWRVRCGNNYVRPQL